MFNFGFKNKELSELSRLGDELYKLKKPDLSAVDKRDIKLKLMKGLKAGEKVELMPVNLKQLGFTITKIARGVRAPAWAVFNLREKVLSAIEERHDYNFNDGWFRKSNFLRTALSSFLLLVFVATSFLVIPLEVSTTYARFTYLNGLNGDVFVLRDGEYLQAKISFQLQEGDVILTKNDSSASVQFFDDSMSRLGENTNMEIKRLYSEPLNPVATDVELYLKEGRMWNKVVNLTDDNASFVVQTNKVEASVSKKAAFDVVINNDDTKITVFDNVVNVVRLDDIENKSKTVVAGFQAQIEHGNGETIKLENVDAVKSETGSDKKWVAQNLQSDKEYDQTLVGQKEKILTSDTATAVLTTSDSVYHDGNNNDASNQKVDEARTAFVASYNNLVKAEMMLVRGTRQDASLLMRDFKNGVGRATGQLPGLMKEDEFNAMIFKSLIEEKIGMQKKDLAAFIPGDPLYPAKESIREAELMLADTELEKVQIKLSQSESQLLDLQELLKRKQYDMAMRVFRDYKRMTLSYNIKVDKDNLAEFQDHLVDIVKGQIRQIKFLTAVEQTLIVQDQVGYRDEVELLRQNILKSLVSSLDKLPDTIPAEVLYDLKDLFESYLADKTEDAKFILPVLDNLVSGKNFITPDTGVLPDQLGVLMIEEKEGTPNAVQVVSKK